MIEVKEVNAQNVFDICELTANKNGIGTTMEEYLCCNATSIAESKYDLEMYPKAIYWNEIPIGFVMYKRTEAEPGTGTICRFMIDYKFQNKGMSKVILMIDDDDVIAKKLYISFGFVFTGKIDKDEYYYELNL